MRQQWFTVLGLDVVRERPDICEGSGDRVV